MTKTKPKLATNIKTAALKTEVKASMTDALDVIGARAVELIREELENASHSGKVYTIKGRLHQASAPDEPPAEYSGKLAASLSYDVDGERGQVTVGSSEPYGAYLEFGTVNMAPRPFIGPVTEALAPEIQQIVEAAFAKTATPTKTPDKNSVEKKPASKEPGK